MASGGGRFPTLFGTNIRLARVVQGAPACIAPFRASYQPVRAELAFRRAPSGVLRAVEYGGYLPASRKLQRLTVAFSL